MYEECRLDYSLGVGKDSVTGDAPTIPDNHMWASSHTTDNRQAYMARLDDPTGESLTPGFSGVLCLHFMDMYFLFLLRNVGTG